MKKIEKQLNTVEKNKNGLVETTYTLSSKEVKKEEEVTNYFEVNIMRKLLEVVDLEKNAEDMVTSEYIVKMLNLEGEEAEKVKKSVIFEIDKFHVMDIPRNIANWKRVNMLTDFKFGTKQKQKEHLEARNAIEVDATIGMVRILPMPQWGEGGGVYAIKIMSDTERKNEIKLVLKYEEEETYAYSEFITVKPSELVYRFEGIDEVKKQVGKWKKLMDYSPAGKELLNYMELYVALCYFNEKITTRTVSSDKLNFENTYELIVRKVYELGIGGVGEAILGEGYYILATGELELIAKEAGYSLKELITLLKERGMLESDKDKKCRNQKTTTRNGIKSKYYCILTGERFNEQCNTKVDMISISEEEFEQFGEVYRMLIGDINPKSEKKKSIKASKKNVLIAWEGGYEHEKD
jgi:hypothetical protein